MSLPPTTVHDMGIELELGILLAISALGQTWFARFEIETSRARLTLKWLLLCGLTIALYAAFEHAAIAVPLLAGAAGAAIHCVWCKRNGIHPLNATPRARYYALRGWTTGSEWASIELPVENKATTVD